jgi:pyruvoyl-dependent arginine decarboxylase (PvlArgDC)
MALLQTQLTTNITTAVKLAQARNGRRGLIIENHDTTNAVVLGGSSVAITGTAGGIQLKPGTILQLVDSNSTIQSEEWWAIAAVGTPIVGVVEQIY